MLRELVTVYRQLSGLALQDADLASVTQLLADRTAATVAVVSPVMDVMAAASPAVPPDEAAATVRTHVVHPRLGQVLRVVATDGGPVLVVGKDRYLAREQ